MSSFFVYVFPLFYHHTYSLNECQILLMTQLRHHQIREPFQDAPALGRDDLLCAPIATYTSP